MQKISTPDLSDLNPSVPFVGLQFNSYGARDFLYGPIKTVHAPNDNSFVKKILATEGQGGVLFVDGNKSFEVALLGDMIAENACKNNWNGIIILGCVRDVEVLKTIDMGIFALGSVPKKSEKKDRGSIDAPIEIDGLIINSNDWVYGDSTGVLVSKVELAIGVEPTTA